LEEIVHGGPAHPWVPPGALLTRGPGAYKLPTANDVPLDFRVELLRDAPCARTPSVHSSKAVGEPPFFLGTAVFWALKDAVAAARADAGLPRGFSLDLPASAERLRMACADALTAELAAPDFRARLSC
jgi:xanthine dehydrogenase/oxidase